jgi:hypothetical protein
MTADQQPGWRVLLVTGSRTWDDVWTLKTHLDQVAADVHAHGVAHGQGMTLIVRHGACYPTPERGQIPHTSADWLTSRWIARFGPGLVVPLGQPGLNAITEQERPADWAAPCTDRCQVTWDGHRRIRRGRSVCSAAGQYRNEAMVAEQPTPTIGLAFLRDGSPGTKGCIKAMKKAGVPYTVIPYDPEGRAAAILAEKGLTPDRIGS